MQEKLEKGVSIKEYSNLSGEVNLLKPLIKNPFNYGKVWKEKLSHGQIFEWKNSHLPTILRVFLCRKNAKNSSDRREAELCSFQTLKGKKLPLGQ